MSFSNITENAILALIFNASPWANYAINATASPQTQIACALHYADPGETGTMNNSEATYTSYTRINVNRDSGGWSVVNDTVHPVANIDFPTATGSIQETETFGSFGKTGGGATPILLSGSLTPGIFVSPGVTPRYTTASTIQLD